jgi:hypothetical protein
MAVKFTTTKAAATANGIKVLVHGPAGSGKTRLCATTGELDKTLIISAEAGLLSIREHDIAVAEVKTLQDVRDAYAEVVAHPGKWRWVCLDSISEIAEVVLAHEKKATKDPRMAYGALQEAMFQLLKSFRDLPMNVYMSCKQQRDEDGRHFPALPGNKLAQGISYLFDEVFALQTMRTDDGTVKRALLCRDDPRYEVKDRSGALAMHETADLAALSAKIRGGK